MTKAEHLILEAARKRDMKNGDRPATEMTKRECFAAMAMQGLLANPDFSTLNIENLIVLAIEHSDELLKQLEK